MALRAYLRVVTNVGASIGTGLAGVALALRSDTALLGALLIDAASFIVAALMAARLPRFAPTRQHRGAAARWAALRNRRYVVITSLDGILCMHRRVLTFGIPLWVGLHTDAPASLVAPLLLVNTAIAVSSQIALARGVTTPRRAAVAMRHAGVALAAGWTLIAAAASAGPTLAITLMVIGVVAHTLGELWQSAGSFELSYSLADASSHGQRQGVFGSGRGVADIVGPALVSALCLNWGAPGWLALALLVMAAGALAPRVVDRMPVNQPAST